MNIWQFQNKISKRLLRWSLMSIGAGLLMRKGGKFWKNVGNQFISWGIIDAGIAIGGQVAARNRVDNLDNPGLMDVKADETNNLGRLLWFNALLDIFYMIGGLMWMRRDDGNGRARGNGFGVLVQGLFLLVFDIFHASKLPDPRADQ